VTAIKLIDELFGNKKLHNQRLSNILVFNLQSVGLGYEPNLASAGFVDLQNTLTPLQRFKDRHPRIATKSGLMVGLGATYDKILEVRRALRALQEDMLAIGQYLQPPSRS
jgi:lipoic acid synthetase